MSNGIVHVTSEQAIVFDDIGIEIVAGRNDDTGQLMVIVNTENIDPSDTYSSGEMPKIEILLNEGAVYDADADGPTITETTRSILRDRKLDAVPRAQRVSYTPDDIRQTFEGETTDSATWVAAATDEQLEDVGEMAIEDDATWSTFHLTLLTAIGRAQVEGS
jgi:hypothetical protein